MRIGLVIERFDPRRGGLEQWCAQYVRELLVRGHEVHVVTGAVVPEVRSMGFIPQLLEKAPTRVAFARAAETRLRTLSLDVIHDTGAGWYCDVFQPHGGSRAALAQRTLRLVPGWMRPLKRWVDPWLPRQRAFAALMQRQYVNDGRLFVALSRGVAADFEHRHGVPPRQIRLVYNGVDPERFSPQLRAEYRQAVRSALGVGDRTVLLLTVAHNFRLKGVPSLLQAMGRLVGRGLPVHLAVVGGRHVRRYRRMAAHWGAERAVSFVGAVDDTTPYYAAADAYAQATYYDPCSLVVLEAMACGLPVLTTGLNGVSELMRDGREGFIIPDPDDIGLLADRIHRFLDPPTRQRLGEAARALTLRHTFQRNVEEMLCVYREAVENRRRREEAWLDSGGFYVRRAVSFPGQAASPASELDGVVP